MRLVRLTVLCVLALVGSLGPSRVAADEFKCDELTGCPGTGSCVGEYWSEDECVLRCFKRTGPNTIEQSGKSTCDDELE
jgi:hypothetical protein